MDITPTTLILVGVICVVLGFIASMLLNSIGDDEAPVEVEQVPPGGRKGQYTPVFRLWRDRSKGALVVEVNGKSLVSPDALDAAERGKLEQAARELRAWLGMGLAAQADEAPAAAPAAAARQAHVSTEAVSAARPIARPAAPPVKGAVEIAPIPISNKSIVMQIEDVLQDMLAGTPLEHRGIHLTEDPHRGVIVTVGLDEYVGIDSVTDPEVQAAIRAAVKEWESQQ